jgi:hypothetical protein
MGGTLSRVRQLQSNPSAGNWGQANLSANPLAQPRKGRATFNRTTVSTTIHALSSRKSVFRSIEPAQVIAIFVIVVFLEQQIASLV